MTFRQRIRYWLWRFSPAGQLYHDEWAALQDRVARSRRGERNRRRDYERAVGWD